MDKRNRLHRAVNDAQQYASAPQSSQLMHSRSGGIAPQPLAEIYSEVQKKIASVAGKLSSKQLNELQSYSQ